jgi:uncharacterized protein YndB with AHSA1/START domain
MTSTTRTAITVESTIQASVEKVWEYWNQPEHIKNWAFATDTWHVPAAENDLRVGGKFSTTMAAKDGSFSFDFGGEYTQVKEHKLIEYTLGDGRKVSILFSTIDGATKVIETFDAEDTNPVDMQQAGWQAILDNFKKYAETN